jgi:hypothetical protein
VADGFQAGGAFSWGTRSAYPARAGPNDAG